MPAEVEDVDGASQGPVHQHAELLGQMGSGIEGSKAEEEGKGKEHAVRHQFSHEGAFRGAFSPVLPPVQPA